MNVNEGGSRSLFILHYPSYSSSSSSLHLIRNNKMIARISLISLISPIFRRLQKMRKFAISRELRQKTCGANIGQRSFRKIRKWIIERLDNSKGSSSCKRGSSSSKKSSPIFSSLPWGYYFVQTNKPSFSLLLPTCEIGYSQLRWSARYSGFQVSGSKEDESDESSI